MKALTLYQPWASLIIAGVKQFETRPRPMSYRGPLAIHAARLPFDRVWNMLGHVTEAVRFEKLCMDLLCTDNLRDLPKGVVLGTVDVVGCHGVTETGFSDGTSGPAWQLTDHTWQWPGAVELALGDFTPGRYAIEMRNPRALETPIPARGQQGLWTFLEPDEMVYERGAVAP